MIVTDEFLTKWDPQSSYDDQQMPLAFAQLINGS